jgi:thiol-disulfide isomerase/thioredoxin
MGDENASTQGVLQSFNIMEVPTFLFFKNGKEVGRHVGSSRGDLIGKILQVGLAKLLRSAGVCCMTR